MKNTRRLKVKSSMFLLFLVLLVLKLTHVIVKSGMFSLFIVFLVLKLTHVIFWSWWWVTAPIWGCFLAFLAIIFVGAWLRLR